MRAMSATARLHALELLLRAYAHPGAEQPTRHGPRVGAADPHHDTRRQNMIYIDDHCRLCSISLPGTPLRPKDGIRTL